MGILLNRATILLTSAVPEPSDQQLKAHVLAGLESMARSGYVAIHDPGGTRSSSRQAAGIPSSA